MLEFETSSGNMYAWDDDVGLFIPFSLTMKAVKEEISNKKSSSREEIIEKLKRYFDPEDIAFCHDWLKKWEKIKLKNNVIQKINATYIKTYILKNGLKQLTLNVTEDCNFRCTYCLFSDKYQYTRSHSNKYMDFEIAKKAIDYYFYMLNEGIRYNPIRKPVIGFYGGEPLLNFELIKKCIDYIKNTYNDYEPLYTMTTNGSLLNEEKINWLMKHQFSLLVSLDGPEEEHNRHRVYRSGMGSFKDVMQNIDLIMKTGYKYIYSSPVFDWKSDLFKLDEFFKRKEIPPISNISLVSNAFGGKYYEQFTKKDHFKFLDQVNKAKISYFENLDNQKSEEKSFFNDLIGIVPKMDLFRDISINSLGPIPFTRACIPGTKIFVDIKGCFHICERINNNFPIGNVEEGLNFEKISSLLNEYISRMDKCSNCAVSRSCRHCYTGLATDKEFLFTSNVCKNVESDKKFSWANSLEIAEAYTEFVESGFYRYKLSKKYCGD